MQELLKRLGIALAAGTGNTDTVSKAIGSYLQAAQYEEAQSQKARQQKLYDRQEEEYGQKQEMFQTAKSEAEAIKAFGRELFLMPAEKRTEDTLLQLAAKYPNAPPDKVLKMVRDFVGKKREKQSWHKLLDTDKGYTGGYLKVESEGMPEGGWKLGIPDGVPRPAKERASSLVELDKEKKAKVIRERELLGKPKPKTEEEKALLKSRTEFNKIREAQIKAEIEGKKKKAEKKPNPDWRIYTDNTGKPYRLDANDFETYPVPTMTYADAIKLPQAETGERNAQTRLRQNQQKIDKKSTGGLLEILGEDIAKELEAEKAGKTEKKYKTAEEIRDAFEKGIITPLEKARRMLMELEE